MNIDWQTLTLAEYAAMTLDDYAALTLGPPGGHRIEAEAIFAPGAEATAIHSPGMVAGEAD